VVAFLLETKVAISVKRFLLSVFLILSAIPCLRAAQVALKNCADLFSEQSAIKAAVFLGG
jgi:hypothetical protein